MYNEIIELPFLGFNTNTKRAIAERKGKKYSILSDDKEPIAEGASEPLDPFDKLNQTIGEKGEESTMK